ncbi:MAG: hypothetical protein ABIP39_07490, partial [Polyangiaceae bacterium]
AQEFLNMDPNLESTLYPPNSLLEGIPARRALEDPKPLKSPAAIPAASKPKVKSRSERSPSP